MKLFCNMLKNKDVIKHISQGKRKKHGKKTHYYIYARAKKEKKKKQERKEKEEKEGKWYKERLIYIHHNITTIICGKIKGNKWNKQLLFLQSNKNYYFCATTHIQQMRYSATEGFGPRLCTISHFMLVCEWFPTNKPRAFISFALVSF